MQREARWTSPDLKKNAKNYKSTTTYRCIETNVNFQLTILTADSMNCRYRRTNIGPLEPLYKWKHAYMCIMLMKNAVEQNTWGVGNNSAWALPCLALIFFWLRVLEWWLRRKIGIDLLEKWVAFSRCDIWWKSSDPRLTSVISRF